MDFKPNAILDGMTREEALACVNRRYGQTDGNNNFFVHAGEVYLWANELLPEYQGCKSDFIAAINAYYDAKDAASKPKWVEPNMVGLCVQLCRSKELFIGKWNVDDNDAEVARTNARRKIEAFIAANGGNGMWEIWRTGAGLITFAKYVDKAGAITCATRELAEAVIEKYGDELRLLMV